MKKTDPVTKCVSFYFFFLILAKEENVFKSKLFIFLYFVSVQVFPVQADLGNVQTPRAEGAPGTATGNKGITNTHTHFNQQCSSEQPHKLYVHVALSCFINLREQNHQAASSSHLFI